MEPDWPVLSLREGNVILIDCDHRTPPASEQGFPYVAIPQLRDGRLDLSGARRITPEHFASHHIYRLRPKQGSPLTSTFLCHLLNSPQMHDIVSGYANGTTVNMLPIAGVQDPLIVVPPGPLVARFDELAGHAQRRSEEIVSESRTLAVLRDTLLPKLISGELRIKDAERIAANVT